MLNQRGNHALIAIVAVLVIAGIGGAGYAVNARIQSQKDNNTSVSKTDDSSKITTYEACTKDESSRIQESYPETCVTKDGKSFTNTQAKVIPADWKWYEDKEHKIAIAYPKEWDAHMSAWWGDTKSFMVTKDSELKVFSGCQDCDLTYNTTAKKWYDWFGKAAVDTDAVVTTDDTAAYLIPMKGAMSCGISALAIHRQDYFIHAALGMCAQPVEEVQADTAKASLDQDKVKSQLPQVLASIRAL